MNKLTKLMLATAILATSGFAGEGDHVINGSKIVKEGGVLRIKDHDVVVNGSGSITLSGSDTSGKGAVLEIQSGKSLTLNGGALKRGEEGEYDPKIELLGALKVISDQSNVNLEKVVVDGMRSDTPVTTFNYWDYKNNKKSVTSLEIVEKPENVITMNSETLKQINLTLEGETGKALYVPGMKLLLVQSGVFTESQWNSGSWIEVDEYWVRNAAWFVETKALSDGGHNAWRATDVALYPANGTLDLSALRAYSADDLDVKDLSGKILNISPESLSVVKLPFNCKFAGIDLSNVDSVEYEIGDKKAASEIKIEGTVIKKVSGAAEKIGDYSSNPSAYGLILPVKWKLKTTPHTIAGSEVTMDLSNMVNDTETYNIAGLTLDTRYLDNQNLTMSSDTTFNFGLSGGGDISVEGEHVVTFAGDNSGYKGNITLPSDVAFAGSKSLFALTKNYTNVTFAEERFSNEVISGTTVTIGKMMLGEGHTLNVSGTLVL